MESRPLNYRSGAQYAAYQTDPTSLSSPYTSLYEWQAPAWPLYPSTASISSHPPFLPLASSSADTSSTSSLAATFGGYQYPYYASNFPNNDLFASTVLHQPRQTPHIVEAPLSTVAPQLTWGTPPTYTPTYSPPVLPQQNGTPPSGLTKRRREEAQDPEKGQGLKATSGKKRRAVSDNSRSHYPFADIAEPQSSQHAAPPPRVVHTARTRRPKERSTRPPSQGDENIPILDESRDSYGCMQDGRAEIRSRGRTLAMVGWPNILNAERTDVPSWANPSIGVGAPTPSPPGEHTWCTPALYEELRNIASALVAQNQASTSGASDGVVQHGPRINEGPPVLSLPGASRAKRRRASVEETSVDWLQVAPEDSQSAEGSTNSTAGVAQGKFLCPFADSSGLCNEPETQKKRKKKRKLAISASDNGASHGPKLSVFTRLTDLERHVLSRHLKAYVHCRRCYEANKPSKFVRYDGFQRHFRSTCSKGTPQLNPKEFAFILMPCYRDPGGLFVKALSGFPKARTAFLLERYLRKKVAKDIRRCKCCAKLDDEEMDAIKAPISAMGDPGVQLRTVSASASEGLDEDRFPPEEEEERVDGKSFSEAGHASNLGVDPLVSSTSYLSEMRSTAQEHRTIDFSDQGEQANQGSLGHYNGVSADDDGTIPESDLDNAFYKSLESLDQLLAQPWTDFGLESEEPDATWMGSS